MKKLLGIVLMTLCGVGSLHAQGQVIRGEITPGVYANVAVDAQGQVKVTGASGGANTTTGSKTAGVAAAESSLAGAIYNSTLPTLTTGQQAAIQIGTRGSQLTQLMLADSTTAVGSTLVGGDAFSNTTLNSLNSRTFGMVFNGVTWDRQIGNTAGTAIIPSRGTFVNRSGTITVGGTSQQVMAANATRRFLMIQNVSDTLMWCNFTAVAVADQPSFQIAPGAMFILQESTISTEAVNCIGAVTGKSFTAKEL